MVINKTHGAEFTLNFFLQSYNFINFFSCICIKGVMAHFHFLSCFGKIDDKNILLSK